MHVSLQVKPRSSRTSVGGSHDGALVVRVRAPASEGRATEEALRALAAALDVPRREVTLVRGATSRLKLVEVPDGVEQRVLELRAGHAAQP